MIKKIVVAVAILLSVIGSGVAGATVANRQTKVTTTSLWTENDDMYFKEIKVNGRPCIVEWTAVHEVSTGITCDWTPR